MGEVSSSFLPLFILSGGPLVRGELLEEGLGDEGGERDLLAVLLHLLPSILDRFFAVYVVSTILS